MREAIKRLVEDEEFIQDWNVGMRHSVMLKKYKCGHSTLYKAVDAAGLERRETPRKGATTGRSAASKAKDVLTPATPPKREKEAPTIPETPTFKRMHDLSIWAAKGSHAKLADLAEIWGVRICAVTGRWHRLRAAG